MKILWCIDEKDIENILTFYQKHYSNPFVSLRVQRNVEQTNISVTKPDFFYSMVACLITTQQRSGPGSAVTRFLNTDPFLLSYKKCINQNNITKFVADTITAFGGLRRANRISSEISENLFKLESGLWEEIFQILNELQNESTIESERRAAEFIDINLKGFGPKQSRNMLQSLGFTKYEIPIDSRITKWLNKFGFPVRLSANALSDSEYYNFISDGIQALCEKSGILPCVLDAVIFSSFDEGGWTEENVIW
jgi:thermostable 8-oxoguanine DNA glycosylase